MSFSVSGKPEIFYLHGFASSARSSKGQFLAERLAMHGLDLICPDFNEPDFSSLTITRMLQQLESRIVDRPSGPVVLIGSSLGAFVAVMAAGDWERAPWSLGGSTNGRRRDRPITRLVLLAPALDFSLKNDKRIGPDRLEAWRATNELEVFHYGEGVTKTVGYQLYEDAQRYDPLRVEVNMPALVFQGTRDESVDPAMVARWARTRSTVTLRLLEDDHQLLGSLEQIWRDTARFLSLAPA